MKRCFFTLMFLFWAFLGIFSIHSVNAATGCQTEVNPNFQKFNHKNFNPSDHHILDKNLITNLSNSLPFVPSLDYNYSDKPEYSFLTKMENGVVFVKEGEIIYLLRGENSDDAWVFKEKINSKNQNKIIGLTQSETTINYFIGNNPEKWKTNLKAYNELSLGEIANKITLSVRKDKKSVEKIFVIEKGGNPKDIVLEIDGAEHLMTNDRGELLIKTGIGEFKMTKPFAYQEINGEKKEIPVKYEILAKNDMKKTYTFNVGEYNKKYPLIIDPLLASTFLGGESEDQIAGMLFDQSGNLVVSGYTVSTKFPTTTGAYQTAPKGSNDVFIARFTPDLKQLLSLTLFGGRYDDNHGAIAMDNNGNIFIVGSTNSDNLPTTTNAYMKTYERNDAFLAKFNPSLNSLLASTYFRLNDAYWSGEGFYRVAVDSAGNVYAAGHSDNSGTLPTNGYKTKRTTLNTDVLIIKMDNNLTQLLGGTLLGGDKVGYDYPTSLTIDSSGNVFITGTTSYYKDGSATKHDFPTTSGSYQSVGGVANVGCNPSFIAKFNSNLTSLLASTFIGGPGNDEAINNTPGCGFTNARGHTTVSDLTFDSSGNIFITGWTDTWRFPVTKGAYDTTYGDGNLQNHWYHPEAFVMKLDNNLSKALATTFLGGTNGMGIWGHDHARSITVDSNGQVYVAGVTNSYDFPTTPDAYDSGLAVPGWYHYDHRYDGFISVFDNNLSKLIYSSYLGGKYNEDIFFVRVDKSGNMFLGGNVWTDRTENPNSDFPVTAGSFDTTPNGRNDIFITKMNIPKDLSVEIKGQRNIAPGGEATYVLTYKNGMEKTAENVILKVSIPDVAEMLSIEGGNSYYIHENREIFWKLGNLPRDAQGQRSFTIKIPFGLPNSDFNIVAKIDAKNSEERTIKNIDYYINYTDVSLVSVRELNSTEILQLLADSKIKAFYDKAKADGFIDIDYALTYSFSNGKRLDELYLLKANPLEMIKIKRSGTRYQTVRQTADNKLEVSDGYGGIIFDFNTNTKNVYGSWYSSAVSSLIMQNEIMPDYLISYAQSGVVCDTKKCLENCAVETLAWLPVEAAQKALLGTFDTLIKLGRATYHGVKFVYDPNAKDGRKFVANLNGGIKNATIDGKPVMSKAFSETAKYGLKAIGCFDDCLSYPESHCCSGERRECVGEGSAWIKVSQCNTSWGIWGLFPSYRYCISGYCNPDNPTLDGCLSEPCDPKKSRTKCKGYAGKIQPAHDPNVKIVDISGSVRPGSTLNYTIQYENVGTGTAYGVFIVDKVSEYLDENSLVIQNKGEYLPASRVIMWDIGELAAKQKGEVKFSARVKSNTPANTEITNYAEVHFPSAKEITPTNVVKNVVSDLTAKDMAYTTTSGTPLNISLSGTGGSFVVASQPLFGTLTGTPPNIVYQSMDGFTGIDEFYYAISSGSYTSPLAKVTITVQTNKTDRTAPTVISTYPNNNGVTSISDYKFDNYYIPFITATFSENMDSSTINSANFKVTGLTGDVSYDDATKTAYFKPKSQLDYGKVYTATISKLVKDKNGNTLTSDYKWSFNTTLGNTVSYNHLQQWIAGLYVAYYKRAPDYSGFDYWYKAISSGNNSFYNLSAGFASHPMFKATYGGMNNEQFVRAVYQNMLGNSGDEGGIRFWTNALNQGKSRSDFIADFIPSVLTTNLDQLLSSGQITQSEYNAAVIRTKTLANKIDVALYFTIKFGNLTNPTTSDPNLLLQDKAYLAAINVIKNVTDVTKTVTDTKTILDQLANNPDPMSAISNSLK